MSIINYLLDLPRRWRLPHHSTMGWTRSPEGCQDDMGGGRRCRLRYAHRGPCRPYHRRNR